MSNKICKTLACCFSLLETKSSWTEEIDFNLETAIIAWVRSKHVNIKHTSVYIISRGLLLKIDLTIWIDNLNRQKRFLFTLSLAFKRLFHLVVLNSEWNKLIWFKNKLKDWNFGWLWNWNEEKAFELDYIKILMLKLSRNVKRERKNIKLMCYK